MRCLRLPGYIVVSRQLQPVHGYVCFLHLFPQPLFLYTGLPCAPRGFTLPTLCCYPHNYVTLRCTLLPIYARCLTYIACSHLTCEHTLPYSRFRTHTHYLGDARLRFGLRLLPHRVCRCGSVRRTVAVAGLVYRGCTLAVLVCTHGWLRRLLRFASPRSVWLDARWFIRLGHSSAVCLLLFAAHTPTPTVTYSRFPAPTLCRARSWFTGLRNTRYRFHYVLITVPPAGCGFTAGGYATRPPPLPRLLFIIVPICAFAVCSAVTLTTPPTPVVCWLDWLDYTRCLAFCGYTRFVARLRLRCAFAGCCGGFVHVHRITAYAAALLPPGLTFCICSSAFFSSRYAFRSTVCIAHTPITFTA